MSIDHQMLRLHEWMDEMAVMIEHGVQVGKPVVVIGDLNCDLLHPNLIGNL